MIAKGNLHAHGQKLAAYMITGKMGERAELVDLRGFASASIREAFIDVMIQAEATRCEKPFFHCYIRLPDGEALAPQQWQHVADRIEKQLGFEGQGRAVAFHHDRSSGETHMHMAWSRIDLETMRAIDPGLYKNKLKEISRQLEKELGLTQVRNERPEEQKTRSAGRNEFEQARRLDTDLKTIRETIRACWERSDSGRSFAAALAEQGYVLARGDRRDFVVVDHAGGDHALGKRITGATAAETRARLADIDRASLPSVDAAKALQAEQARTVPTPELQPAPSPAPERQEPRPEAAFAAAARETIAPERPQEQEHPAAARQTAVAEPVSTPAPNDRGTRSGADVAARGVGVVGKIFDIAVSLFEGIFGSAPPLPTPEEEKRQKEETVERQAHAYEAKRTQDDDFRRLLEQMARNDAERREREQPRDRGDDRDDDRGRERER